MASVIAGARRIVVKVGSSLVTNEGRGVDAEAIGNWARQLAALAATGREVVMVSSGAIAEGMKRLGWTKRPKELHELQAAAAVGQMGLVQMYESRLAAHGMASAQVLLTHADLADRERYLNARSTLLTLLALKVIPVINENDTVVNDEIKFGDNDTLGALVANLVDADAYVILTDQRGLYSADPRQDPQARFIAEATAGDPALEAMAGGAGSGIGRGGMLTKILAARRAAGSGTSTVIAWAARATCCCAWPPARPSAQRSSRARPSWRRASSGWSTTCSCAGPWRWTTARRPSCALRARACCRSACARSRATSCAATSSRCARWAVPKWRAGWPIIRRPRRD